MEPKPDVLAVLESRARKTSLEELKARGRRNVRVIKASDIARLIDEAVQRALEARGLDGEHQEALSAEAREEFERLKQEKAAEAAELERLRAELAARGDEIERLRGELQAARAGAPAADQASTALMMKMMEELLSLKQGATAGGGGEVAGKLEQLASTLEQKLERLGRKIGVTDTVEADIDYESLVSRTVQDAGEVESNLDNLEVEKRKGAGIGGALERMKKLRGDG